MTQEESLKVRHDFKNHLGIILGFSELLIAHVPAGDTRRGDLEEIHTAANAALDLLAQLFPDRAARPDETAS